jgi:hypothetical protein
MESERVCSRCGTINRADAKYCETCAAPLDAATESGAQFVEDDLALRHVDPNNRVELDRFERWDEAELACGLLRFNNIACELSPMPLPGLPADIILWCTTPMPNSHGRYSPTQSAKLPERGITRLEP